MKYLNKSALFILPLVYLILGTLFNQIIGAYSMRNVDPEYIYLTNGLYMSLGHLNVYHIDNPGTPLQLIVAIICRVIYLFRPHHLPYIEDVIVNSDLYLNIINNVVIALSSVVLYAAGQSVLRITSFLPYALLIQSAPFFHHLTYAIIGRLVPELLMFIPVIILSILIIKNIAINTERFGFKTILLFSAVSAFGLSVKITYMPIVLIPLFFIPRFYDKGKYLLFTIIGFFVFALPVIFNLNFLFRWMKSLLLNSGKYGGGDANIVDPGLYLKNLGIVYKDNTFFIFFCLVFTVLTMLYFIIRWRTINRRLAYVSVGIVMALFVLFLLVTKQYENRYLAPGFALFPLMAILAIEMVKEIFTFRYIKTAIGLAVFAGFLFMIPYHMKWIRMNVDWMTTEMVSKRETAAFAATLEKDAIKLITPKNYGCPFHDFSVMIGHCWAGWANEVFLPYYQKINPRTYYYFPWEGRAKYWHTPYDINQIISQQPPVYLYIGDYTEEIFNKSLEIMLPGYELNKLSYHLVFENQLTTERIYRLYFDEQ